MMKAISILLWGLIAVSAAAQSNEVAITAGGYFALPNPLSTGSALALEGSVAHRIASVPVASLYLELPVAGSFQSSVPAASLGIARNYTSLFVAPGLRLRLAPSFPVTPYLALGGGYARFDRKLNNGTTSTNNAGVFDIGGGVDVKILPFVSLRGELRDFDSGSIGLQSLVFGRQHNLFATAGIALKF
jgi:hypothetical protein